MLEQDYYLTNFRYLINFVVDTYQGLLRDDELQWHAAFIRASEPSQRLYVRLSGRRASAFRQSKLSYSEITSISDAAQTLSDVGLATADAPVTLEELLRAYTKPELIKLLQLEEQKQLSRSNLVAYVVDRNLSADITALQEADNWVSINGLSAYTVFKLCFFGNCYQDMSEFVLRDLGVFQYEQYQIDKYSRVFQSRKQIEAHLQYFECASILDQIDQSDAEALLRLDQALPETSFNDPHLKRRVERLRNAIARQLERLNRPEQALVLYSFSSRPPSRERQVRLLMKFSRFDDAMQLCGVIKATPIADEELQFVDTILPKLHKALSLPQSRRRTFKPATSKLTLSRAKKRVEFVARDFYSQFGDCFYTENTLINGVLGLFIWDIVFAPVEGVFYNPFQSAPADFYQPEFVQTRQALIDLRLQELEDPIVFSARVWDRYELSFGTVNPLVSWQYLSKDLLSLALVRIPTLDWLALFNRMLNDLRNHTTGFPDLILFPTAGSYELLEIKGPGDAVQKNQRRWMAYFAQHRIPYRVVHIRWANLKQPA